MPQVSVPGVGVFERTAIQSPWGDDEFVRYQTISFNPPREQTAWIPILIAALPSFAIGVLVGIVIGI
jgi:hypothetical protein